MTHKEALYRVKGYLTDIIPTENYSEVEEIIKALERQPCDDAISREAVMRLIENKPYDWSNLTERHNMLMKIRKLPSVTQQTGEWIHLRGDMYECSKCRKIYTSFEIGECDANYCPNCGARMIEPQESEDKE